jgi:hypothetical protein
LRRLGRASGLHSLKERDRLLRPVERQLKLVGLQPVNEATLPVKDHDLRLHQLRVDSYDIIRLLLRLRARLFLSVHRRGEGYERKDGQQKSSEQG